MFCLQWNLVSLSNRITKIKHQAFLSIPITFLSGPTKKTTRGFHPQSPAAPDEDKQVFRISRFNASQGSQIKSQGSAWEMSWEPRRPSTPTLPHSPRQLKQQVVGLEAQHPREFKRGHPPSTTNPNKRL